MIIDAHLHLGKDLVWDVENTEEDVITGMDSNGVDAALIRPPSSEPLVSRSRADHDRIAALGKVHPGRIFGMANVHIYNKFEFYTEEITRAVKELGFVGVFLDAGFDGTNPLGQRVRKVLGLLQELGVPAVVHTGKMMPGSNPAQWILPATEFPDVKLVLAHSGQGPLLFDEVMVAASVCDNMYMETSDTRGRDIVRMIQEFGADRVMFGSDGEDNMAVELFKWCHLPISDKEREQCLWRTAATVFGLSVGG